MRYPHFRSVKGVSRAMLFAGVGCAACLVFLSSRSAAAALQPGAHREEPGASGVRYSIVCIIHGDGDYLYHDSSGTGLNADEEALARMKSAAEHNPFAEVFIFHQKARRHSFIVFPIPDGEFYYYRNGVLAVHDAYWRDEGESRFEIEAALYRRHRADDVSRTTSVFLYCGHEVPESDGAGYDASYPDRQFTVQDLAAGLQDFRRSAQRFDLLVLSTCFGGTPYTIGAVGAFARCVVASPENLHLSYFDITMLERLDLSLPAGEDIQVFAKKFARRAFDRLTHDVQTAVSISVYDVDSVQGYVQAVSGAYEKELERTGGRAPRGLAMDVHTDCADVPAYALPAMRRGVDVFYRPASFGRLARKLTHSGWECRAESRKNN